MTEEIETKKEASWKRVQKRRQQLPWYLRDSMPWKKVKEKKVDNPYNV